MDTIGINFENKDAIHLLEQGSETLGIDVLAGLLHVQSGKSLKDLHVLDAGCDTGRYAKDLVDIGIGKITLLDNSLTMLEMAREKLKDEICSKTIDDIVTAALPDLPFPQATFDVVIFNFVFHYLDADCAKQGFPKIAKTVRNTKSILKQNGLVAVTTLLPAVWRDSVWYSSLVPEITNVLVKKLPTTEELVELFANSGFRCVSAINFLRHGSSAGILNYLDPEGPLDPKWRIASVLIPDNVKAMEDNIVEMRQNGSLEKYMTDRDHTSEFGFASQFMFKSI